MLNIPLDNIFFVDNETNNYIKENLFNNLQDSLDFIIRKERNFTFNYPIRFELNKKLNESYTL